jgi:hypothetical protein
VAPGEAEEEAEVVGAGAQMAEEGLRPKQEQTFPKQEPDRLHYRGRASIRHVLVLHHPADPSPSEFHLLVLAHSSDYIPKFALHQYSSWMTYFDYLTIPKVQQFGSSLMPALTRMAHPYRLPSCIRTWNSSPVSAGLRSMPESFPQNQTQSFPSPA